MNLAIASGSFLTVQRLVEEEGVDVNKAGDDGLLPLCIASFWGYVEIVKYLLEKGADVNGKNPGNGWTALHSAAMQGHGKVVFELMDGNPDLLIEDRNGCTAVDYASALDNVWPHFAMMGAKRTPKRDLIAKNIIFKVEEEKVSSLVTASHLNRPGSSYAFRARNPMQRIPLQHSGDVLGKDTNTHGHILPQMFRH
eukprot:m.53593 g.53593  ORF g.53593 m.53593 type:complete len:196 (+) comp7673_c0_seq1:33-620(+)